MTYDLKNLTHPLKIKERIQETADAATLVFSVPDEKKSIFRFGTGQFITLFLEIGQEIVPRSYSIPASPLVDEHLCVTVKRVAGGKGSNFILDRLKVGDTVRVSPPSGHFFAPPQAMGANHYVLFAAGSGITPIFSILKTALTTGHTVTLIYANRSQSTTIYRAELNQWQQKYGANFSLVEVLSQPEANWSGLRGRCEGKFLKDLAGSALNKNSAPRQIYLCGPDGFMKGVRQALLEIGIPKEAIREESFVTTHTPTSSGPEGRVWIGPDQVQETAASIVAIMGGEEISCPALPGKTVLESLIAAGANPPYSCLEGSCMACLAKVQGGRVYQDDPGILNDDNFAQGETLTCQAMPCARIVRIDYDSF